MKKKKYLFYLFVLFMVFTCNMVYAVPMNEIYAGFDVTITSPKYNVSTGEMQYYTVESDNPSVLKAEILKINGVCASFGNCEHSLDIKLTALKAGVVGIYIKDDNGETVYTYVYTVRPGPEIIPDDDLAEKLEDVNMLLAVGESRVIDNISNQSNYDFDSLNSDIADVTEEGVIIAKNPGIANISVTAPNGGGAYIVRVGVYVPVKNIEILGGNRTYDRTNINEYLKVNISPSNATYKNVQWYSDNKEIIDVTSDGYPIIKKNGQAKIRACAVRDNICSSIIVTATNIIENIKIPAEKNIFNVGEKKKIEYVTTPNIDMSKKDISWSSLNESILKVDQKGEATALKPGKVVILMKINSDSMVVMSELEVKSPITSLTPSFKEKTLLKGESAKVTVNINPKDTTDDKTLVWESIDKSVATVDQNGNIKALKAGMTYISVTASNGKSTLIKIIVKNPVLISGVKLNKSSVSIVKGLTTKLSATINPSNTTQSKVLTWSSSNTKVATVDKNGVVKGIKAGTANITVKTSNGKTAVVKVKVTNPIAIKSIKLNKSKISLAIGKSSTMKVVVTPNNATIQNNISWSSSNKKIATVDKNGKITAIGAGTAKITVKTSNGKKATVKVTVSKINAKKATIMAIKNQTQTGKAIKTAVEVKLNGKTLKNGTDYTVSYKNNKNAGKATVTVKFKGNYTGTKTGSFLIIPKKVDIKNPSTAKKSITVKYSKVSGAKTYQIAYRLKGTKKWSYTTSKTASKKISKLTTGKQYEVMVRAGIKSGSKTLYGAWSNTKVIKVK